MPYALLSSAAIGLNLDERFLWCHRTQIAFISALPMDKGAHKVRCPVSWCTCLGLFYSRYLGVWIRKVRRRCVSGQCSNGRPRRAEVGRISMFAGEKASTERTNRLKTCEWQLNSFPGGLPHATLALRLMPFNIRHLTPVVRIFRCLSMAFGTIGLPMTTHDRLIGPFLHFASDSERSSDWPYLALILLDTGLVMVKKADFRCSSARYVAR